MGESPPSVSTVSPQYGVAAARLAIDDAMLVPEREDRDRVGVSMGSALGGIAYAEQEFPTFLTEGIRSVNPSLALSVFGGAVSCNIAIEHGFTGPNSTNAMSCASGTIAVGDAFRRFAAGPQTSCWRRSEAPLAPLCFGAFSSSGRCPP